LPNVVFGVILQGSFAMLASPIASPWRMLAGLGASQLPPAGQDHFLGLADQQAHLARFRLHTFALYGQRGLTQSEQSQLHRSVGSPGWQ
jgi:hypothetical protein